MGKLNPRRDKAENNASFAARFKKRSKKIRRLARLERTCKREQAWLEQHGIEPSPDNPPCRRRGKRK